MTKAQKNRMDSLHADNLKKSKQIESLTNEQGKLKDTNSVLFYERQEYETTLRAEIERIQKLGPWKRFWDSVELFKNLFEVIQQGFKE